MWLGPPHGGQSTQDAERAGRSILTEPREKGRAPKYPPPRFRAAGPAGCLPSGAVVGHVSGYSVIVFGLVVLGRMLRRLVTLGGPLPGPERRVVAAVIGQQLPRRRSALSP